MTVNGETGPNGQHVVRHVKQRVKKEVNQEKELSKDKLSKGKVVQLVLVMHQNLKIVQGPHVQVITQWIDSVVSNFDIILKTTSFKQPLTFIEFPFLSWLCMGRLGYWLDNLF